MDLRPRHASTKQDGWREKKSTYQTVISRRLCNRTYVAENHLSGMSLRLVEKKSNPWKAHKKKNQPDDIQQHLHIHQLNDKHTGLSWWNFSKDTTANQAQYPHRDMNAL